MGRIGFGELIVIFAVILLLFGAKKLPEIGSALGKAIKEFKRASRDTENGSNETKENTSQKS